VRPMVNRSMLRLHRLYYVLALFNVITLAASLYLGHEMIEIVKSSAAIFRDTQLRLERYSELGEDDRQQAMQLGAAGYYVKANLSLRELGVQVDQLVQRDDSN
jgi:hypothetical protein